MNNLKEEIIKVLNVIEESIETNCPDEQKIKQIENTKNYIVNNDNKEEKIEEQ